MEEKKFINRREEFAGIIRALNRKGAELIILSGRRRIGKSRLLREINGQFPFDIFVMLEEADYYTNLNKITDEIASRFELPSFSPTSLKEAFRALPPGSSIVIDEISYLPEITGEFQVIWEEIAKPNNIKIILSGSLIRIMEDMTYSLTSPLYGRATFVVKLMPLSCRHILEWYGTEADIENVLLVNFVVGGIPRYLELVEIPSAEAIQNAFFSRDSVLLREGKLLLKESFPSSLVIPKILFSVATGYTTATSIANSVQVPANEISKYLSLLCDYGYVERRFPVFKGGKKDVRFYPLDRFFSFWTHFVWKFYNQIESGSPQPALAIFNRDFNAFCGLEFERIVQEIIQTTSILGEFEYTLIGKQWGRIPSNFQLSEGENKYEIDLCLANENTKDILFVECKWQDSVNAPAILKVLLEKTQYVDWNLRNRIETFAIFAKSFKKTVEEYQGHRVICIDLNQIKHALKQQLSDEQ